jgi:hypothetical protein
MKDERITRGPDPSTARVEAMGGAEALNGECGCAR